MTYSRVHLLNRLFKTDLEYIINHAEDQFILLDPAFVDLMVQLQSRLPTVQGFIVLTDRQHMPQHNKLKNMLCYEELIKASECRMQLSAHGACPRKHVCVMGLWKSLYSILLGKFVYNICVCIAEGHQQLPKCHLGVTALRVE